MEQMELFVSWIREAVSGLSQNAFDPKPWGVLFAILILVSIWSIVRALGRLTRQLSSAVTELSEIRSILKKVERSVEPVKARPPTNDQGEADILNLPLRERDDRR
ncbi:MAG: hypothetical protein C3F14_00140 [Deltaproteobacteria bacterium]|nr:MAG: hypothetical protein C3F14_00140 [Deltaproteobacteria bacterium]